MVGEELMGQMLTTLPNSDGNVWSEVRVVAYLADADPNGSLHRALLDRRVVCDLLGFDEAASVRGRPTPVPEVVRRSRRCMDLGRNVRAMRS